ncbi:uncharacterized protein PG998_005193 [Apiospora kogelbergensis]|uniref:uncharacterized protein n=1 Tax=Apiospora kogelbergensis TaxID=1337665 RepID=UPI00312ED531
MTLGNAEEALEGSNATANPKLPHEASEDIAMGNAAGDVFSTPQHPGFLAMAGSTSIGRRPQTRSMTRSQVATSRPKKSKLEDSQDIEYSAGGYQRAQRAAPLRKSPKFRLATDLQRDSTPDNKRSNTPSGTASETTLKRRRAKANTQHSQSRPLRRSARLFKPLTEFQKYPDLPNELKLAIWEESASEPRLVYIRNRNASLFTHEVQNATPTWFETDENSAEVASRRYRKMFSQQNPTDNRTEQYVNPDADIVLLEPCCGGCRGYHCVRNQFSESDRAAVRRLAVQTEPSWLMPSTMSCWATLSLSWPNIEILYLVQTAITGDSKTEKALVRSVEGDREDDLRKRFDEWKKTDGKNRVLTKLEFAAVVTKDDKDVAQRRGGRGGCHY